MKKATLFIMLLLTITQITTAQDTLKAKDSINAIVKPALKEKVSKNTDSIVPEKRLFIGVDFTNRYIWRGQVYGGHFFAIQPYVEYAISNKFTAGIWATTNFRENVYLNNQYGLRGYKELSLSLIYTINDYYTIRLDDYYAPIKDKRGEDYNNKYFYYGESSAKILDLSATFDFTEKGLPLSGILSTYISGYDFRYDSNKENPKRNFTTYLEVTYTLANLFENFELSPTAGLLFNNEAQSYINADYDKLSFINLRLDAIKTFKLTNSLNLPISLSYTHNASTKNVEFSGRNFFQATLSLTY